MDNTSYEAEGEITHIGEVEVISDKFKKREFIMQVSWGDWPNFMKFQFVQKAVTKLNNFEIGDKVVVTFNIKGNLNKNDSTICYTNLSAWKIDEVRERGASNNTGNNIDPWLEDDVPF